MNRVISSAIAACLLWGLNGPTATAQESVLAEMYGQGVHAYFAGDYRTAHQLLTHAIDQGIRDPRSYLFRGLTYAVLGRPDEAEADFKRGAELEVTGEDRVYPVSDSLQRIQGRTRLQIERHRQLARLSSRGRSRTAEQARFDELQRAEQDVLRSPRNLPAAPRSVPAAPLATESSDPFAEDRLVQPEKAPERKPPAIASPPPPASPFGAPATPPAEADPFGTTPAPRPATDDPFGTTPAPRPATDDPFGTPPATPKNDALGDPFGDDKPSAKPVDDPFGE